MVFLSVVCVNTGLLVQFPWCEKETKSRSKGTELGSEGTNRWYFVFCFLWYYLNFWVCSGSGFVRHANERLW